MSSLTESTADDDPLKRRWHIHRHHTAAQSGSIIKRSTAKLAPVTDIPQLEAEVLLAHVLETSRTGVIAHPERSLTPGQQSDFQKLVRRRVDHYPLPYLTSSVEFYGLEFEISPEVLIPRPDTETLVELALARQPETVVDVGTGSGCIAAALATHLPQARIFAIDISTAALAVAQRNVERLGVANRVQLMVGDVLSPRPGPVDLIVSNPPYIPSGDCASLPDSVRDYEPRLALDGGLDGFDVIRDLLAQAPAVLKPGGALLIEIGADQGRQAVQLAQAYFPNGTARVHPDLAGRDRVLEVNT